MQGGTLLVSRLHRLHSHFKKELETLGFPNVEVTGEEKDGLNMIINDKKPSLLIMGASFYSCSTPYMMSELLRQFPKLNITAVSISHFPADLAMWFIINGVKSYVNRCEGIEQFYHALDQVRDGKTYICPKVQERMEMRKEIPVPAGNITPRQVEVVRLLSNGFTSMEIADTLHLSRRTVENHKTELYTTLNVRNENELIRTAQFLGIINPDELCFYGGNYQLNPKPDEKPTIEKPTIRRIK